MLMKSHVLMRACIVRHEFTSMTYLLGKMLETVDSFIGFAPCSICTILPLQLTKIISSGIYVFFIQKFLIVSSSKINNIPFHRLICPLNIRPYSCLYWVSATSAEILGCFPHEALVKNVTCALFQCWLTVCPCDCLKIIATTEHKITTIMIHKR